MLARILRSGFHAALLLASFGLAISSAKEMPESGSARQPTSSVGAPAPSLVTVSARLLIDRSHGEAFNVSGFTTYLAANGWTVSEHLGGALDAGALASADLLMVPVKGTAETITPFSAAEVAAITSWVASGKGLWMFNEAWTSGVGVNSLASSFGVEFHSDILQDPVESSGTGAWLNITDLFPHPVTAGVSLFVFYGGSCVTTVPPAQLVGRGGLYAHSDDCPVQPGVLAVASYGNGRAVFCGDNAPLNPGVYPDLDAEERLLLQNIANWLAGGSGPTAVTRSTWAKVKSIYR